MDAHQEGVAPALAGGRFSSRLSLVFGALVLALLLAGTLFAGFRFHVLSEEREQSLLRTLALPLATSVRRVTFSGKYHAQLLLEEFAAEDPAVRFILIQTYQGEVFASAGEVPSALLSEVPTQREFPEGVRILRSSAQLRVVEVPFRKGYLAEEIGVLRIGVSREAYAASFQRELAVLLALGLLASGLGVFLVRRFSQRLAEPVEELAAEFRGILRHSSLGICVQDERGRLLRSSANLEELFGWAQERAPASVYELYPSELREELQREDQELLSGARAALRSERALALGEQTRTLLISKFRLGSSEDPHLCSLLVDVTEQRELEQCLLKARRLETVGQFAGGVAHDFNNLLAGIMGSAELARLETRSPEVAEHCGQITEICRRAAELTTRLLTFSRRQVMVTQREDLNALTGEMAVFLGRLLRKSISLSCEPFSSELPVAVDRGQLEQALMNLVGNAQDALEGEGQIVIRTGLVRLEEGLSGQAELAPGTYATLEVSDDGPGIPPELRSRLFDPFATSKRAGEGTGLGLSIVFSVFSRHGGAITCESELGRGTTFRGYLPLDEEHGEVGDSPSSAERSTSGLRILLADDNDAWRQSAAQALERLGHEVTSTADGEAALRAFSATPGRFDLALLDVILPGRNGAEVFLRLREVRPELPVLFMTGYDSQILTRIRQEQGGVHVLTKPFSLEELGERIQSLVGAPAAC